MIQCLFLVYKDLKSKGWHRKASSTIKFYLRNIQNNFYKIHDTESHMLHTTGETNGLVIHFVGYF